MRNIIKQIPIIGSLARSIKKKLFPAEAFTTSEEYWIKRYAQGGNSGAGSYNNLAAFKGEILNSFVARHHIKSVIEFGCGDGNQLTYFKFPAYTGFDVSEVAINNCRNLFKDDSSKQFFHVSQAGSHQAELTLSLDVIYHLIEDTTYHTYMTQLFAASTHYVIIYACDDDQPHHYAPHVKTRKFTNWIKQFRPDFHLIEFIPNQFPLEAGKSSSTSFSDFFIYQKASA
ncbi:class I SAM-dependent methyltransferase [Hymenobacter sp. DH14]|uniref:Class I SAM-dependent methyltransferase n=1 Tax=Hymenobacter cyanobacteriorum TaxID=2926463 RepID=A0A9X1VDU0_9BACT|nr:class I SAM-dependent methyltransferase [Hymenobacter cyanobacteriorum]MCI1186302.1 class I SAM-dependent methyltransferase [Hymenobacter cyanobacteriorum]